MTAILFDVDGTLVDSSPFEDALYRAAVREVLGPVGIHDSWLAYRDVTDSGILRQVMAENGLGADAALEAAVRARFGELVERRLATEPCRPLPGAVAAVRALQADPAVSVGFATGGWGHTAAMKLDCAGFEVDPTALASADDHPARVDIMTTCLARVAPGAERAVYVGDGAWDLAACRELGWGFVAVGTALAGTAAVCIRDFEDAGWPGAVERAGRLGR
jgi:phosphoglycolate phosphatase-like HAD superfamily hydrolase